MAIGNVTLTLFKRYIGILLTDENLGIRNINVLMDFETCNSYFTNFFNKAKALLLVKNFVDVLVAVLVLMM